MSCSEEIFYSESKIEVVDVLSPEMVKAWLDGALGSLSCWVAALPMEHGWGSVIFEVPSNPTGL